MIRKLYFRVDSNPMIANGHVMRCLSIADAAYDLGITPVFISSDDNAASIVKSIGYACIVLGTKWIILIVKLNK